MMLPFRITDMHSHILPGLDDGSKSMEETISALKTAEKQGISRILVTPHLHPGRYMTDADRIYRKLDEVRTEIEKNEIQIQLFPGQECCYYSGLVRKLKSGEALTLAGSRYVLTEFEPQCRFQDMFNAVQELLFAGYQPVLAHFERYECMEKQENRKAIREQGVLMQMNFDTIQKGGFIFGNPWRKAVKNGEVDLFGSDCHGTHFRPLKLERSLDWLEETLSPEELSRILEDNVTKVLHRCV